MRKQITRGPLLLMASLLLILLINRLWRFALVLEAIGGGVTHQLGPLVLMGAALGTDAMSLSIGIGLRGVSRRDIFRVSTVVGVFHVLMPLLGLGLGQISGLLIGTYARWLGAAVVAWIGFRMIRGCIGFRECQASNWVLTGIPLLLLAASVSLDALSVGFSLGVFGYNVLVSALVFGVFGSLLTALGLLFGGNLGHWLGNRAELFGGGVLIILALHMFLEGR